MTDYYIGIDASGMEKTKCLDTIGEEVSTAAYLKDWIDRGLFVRRIEGDAKTANEPIVTTLSEIRGELSALSVHFEQTVTTGIAFSDRLPRVLADASKIVENQLLKEGDSMVCRGCGCTERNPCFEEAGPCAWVSLGLCSRCNSQSEGEEN